MIWTSVFVTSLNSDLVVKQISCTLLTTQRTKENTVMYKNRLHSKIKGRLKTILIHAKESVRLRCVLWRTAKESGMPYKNIPRLPPPELAPQPSPGLTVLMSSSLPHRKPVSLLDGEMECEKNTSTSFHRPWWRSGLDDPLAFGRSLVRFSAETYQWLKMVM